MHRPLTPQCKLRTSDLTSSSKSQAHVDTEKMAAGRIQSDLGRAAQSVRGRLKDLDAIRLAEQELSVSADYLEHTARMGMAALLLVSSLLTISARSVF